MNGRFSAPNFAMNTPAASGLRNAVGGHRQERVEEHQEERAAFLFTNLNDRCEQAMHAGSGSGY